MDPARFDEMRPGCFDIEARVADMDIDGDLGLVVLPVARGGVLRRQCSRRAEDPELGLACVRAWNDWHLEEWAGTYPERIIPLQLPWLADVATAATEVRANAARGFKAVVLPRVPRPARVPVHLLRLLGPVLGRRARRPGPWCACTRAPPPGRRFPRPTRPSSSCPTLFPVNALLAAGGVALVRGGPALPRPRDRAVRGGHRLGAHADGSSRTTSSPIPPRAPRAAPGRRICARARCSDATSGSAPSTTLPSCPCSTASASTT